MTQAVTPWNVNNRVRLLNLGSSTWLNYQYNTASQYWYKVGVPGVAVDPALVPGMGLVFIRAGFDDLTDMLTESIWYFRPPNNW